MNLKLFLLMIFVSFTSCEINKTEHSRTLSEGFITPPDNAKPRVYWWWLFNRVTKEGIQRDLEEFKAKGISGVNLISTGGYAGTNALLGEEWLGEKWKELFRFALTEANRLNIELGFNMAGGWTMMGPWVTQDNAMKKVVQTEQRVVGGKKVTIKLDQPKDIDNYYHDIIVQAYKYNKDGKTIEPNSVLDITSSMTAEGMFLHGNATFEWDAPEGEWLVVRSGYTLTGHIWSKWFAYPKGDTFKGAEGYEIDYLKTEAVDQHFKVLGELVIEEAKKVGGKIAYLWSDSWECGKLTWTQDFKEQFIRFRGYDPMPYMATLSGHIIGDSTFTARFRDDYNKTIQDCIAENFYGRFEQLCHENGMLVGNEGGGPNDVPPLDALKNLGKCDIPAGEFWTKYELPEDGMNSVKYYRLNLKQTSAAAHVYGKREAMAESFTQMEPDRTHWSMGPGDMKPYANDAFCEGINRIMLHQSTCQPPSDGKPGYEFCAGQHFTPNITWWEQSPAFFSFLSRCSYMLQQGKFVADVCFFLGEQTPSFAPPKYVIPTLGSGYDCDYANADVLLNRMSVKDDRIVLPDGMSYRVLDLQNCVSPVAEIARAVARYQGVPVSHIPSRAMSPAILKKIKQLIEEGATVVGVPPVESADLKNFPKCDDEVRALAAEIWGDLDGKSKTERKLGKGRIIWGKTVREVLLADGVTPDFTYPNQELIPDNFDYIHRTDNSTEIYYVINRTGETQVSDFTFRISGKQPEIWDPQTGEMRDAKAFTQNSNGVTIPIEFAPYSSFFIVFRNSISENEQGVSNANFPALKEIANLSSNWKVSFDTKMGGPAEVEFITLDNWINRTEDGIKHYSGTATYRKTFDMPQVADTEIYLDLGDVRHIAEVRLNGQKLATLWSAPWRVKISKAVKSKENLLEIDVTNLWANRVIGDFGKPKEKRYTQTHEKFRFDMLRDVTPLNDSGLLGPVTICFEKQKQL